MNTERRRRLRGPEGRAMLALAALAGLRVLVFSLGFPFFTNIDEYRHVDVVLKYARGYIPLPGSDAYEPETVRLVATLGSPEYHRHPTAPTQPEVPPPVWRAGPEVRARRLAEAEAFFAPLHSLEAFQPPVYYASAGAWLALGRALGLGDEAALYWVRALGGVVGFALVLSAWLLLRDVYADDVRMRVGVPLLLAFLPQDAMYYVTGDLFSPLVGGLGFLLALRLLRRPESGAGAYAVTGLVLAAAFLTKYPNAAVAVATAFCCVVAVRSRPAARALRGEGGRWLLLWAALLVPAAFWLLRNRVLFGDLTATAVKLEALGWGRMPAVLWSRHPIFTPSGAWEFLTRLSFTSWRGELAWHRVPLAWPTADWIYAATTLAFIPLAGWASLRPGRRPGARLAEGAALVATLAGVGTLAFLSLVFVFHETSNPSVDHPFFVHGRLISGVMVPAALLWVRGLDAATRWLREPWAGRLFWGALVAVLALATASELALSRPVFSSAYNWFHLP